MSYLKALFDYAVDQNLDPTYVKTKVQWQLRLTADWKFAGISGIAEEDRDRVIPVRRRTGTNDSAGDQPEFAVDNTEYVTGVGYKNTTTEAARTKDMSNRKNQSDAWLARHEKLAMKYPQAKALAGVVKALRENGVRELARAQLEQEYPNPTKRWGMVEIVFSHDGQECRLQEMPEMKDIWREVGLSDEPCTLKCCVTGELSHPMRLFPKVDLSCAGRSGSVLLSYNDKMFGSMPGVGLETANLAAAALRHLMPHSLRCGDSRLVLIPKHGTHINTIKQIREFIQGKSQEVDECKKAQFSWLLLRKNKSRICVDGFGDLSGSQVVVNIEKWTRDLTIDECPPIPSWVVSDSMSSGDTDGPRNQLAVSVARVFGMGHDQAWLFRAVKDALLPIPKSTPPNGGKKDDKQFRFRNGVSIAKLILSQTQVVPTALDESCPNKSYRLGRVFALLAQIQYLARKEDLMRHHELAEAASDPGLFFPRALARARHHAKQARTRGHGFAYGILKEAFGLYRDGRSVFFDTEAQAWFFLGYHQQRERLMSGPTKTVAEVEDW